MNIESFDTTSNFDVQAANRERLEWRLGGELPTERALGVDEAAKRAVAAQIELAQADSGEGKTEDDNV